MPKEASNHFGEKLFPFIKAIATSDPSKPYEEMNDIPLEIKNAITCCHGKLTPPYKYIADLRKINEETEAKQRKYQESIDEMARKTSTLRRGVRFSTVVFTGNLFDTFSFNEILNIFEKNGVQFRIVEWEVGNTTDKESTVCIQVVAESEEALDKAKEEVEV